jgi:hypothetical protein
MRAAVVLLVAAAVASASASAAAPRLRIVDRSPLVLVGSGFGAGERVTVTVVLGGTKGRRLLRSSAAGAFRAGFPKLVYDRCHGALAVTAVGARGHRAAFAVQPLPCPDSGNS